MKVDNFSFHFAPSVRAGNYDKWRHYATVLMRSTNPKAMDVVAVDGVPPSSTAWLIEAKDFRVITTPPKPCNLTGLAQTVADKSIDALAGLAHAQVHAVLTGERQMATDAIASSTRRVVLHLEPHTGRHSTLFPTNFAANILQQLRQLVRGIDPNPLVLNISNTNKAGVPWSVR